VRFLPIETITAPGIVDLPNSGDHNPGRSRSTRPIDAIANFHVFQEQSEFFNREALMITRRHFCATAASAAILARAPNALAQASYELIIKGGRVIDPSIGIDAVRDVAVSAGKIAAVAPDITAGAADTIDARGKLVVPGLIDIHTHAGRSKEGPPMCLQDGVTGWVDAGSGGADNMDAVAAVARGAPQIGRCLINIARTGVAPGGELHDLTRANVDLARGARPSPRE
jgi:dihydroorotase